ncbi:hypothetical protein ZOSMA_78G00300 [Zostera marina]|uniref:Uncharacterized protein n=1 Tax=Zostera marina TaxID=29655 RepID=A0A0K9NQA5_ZOSMR|nr:hypothetical protein ZOSMA_78G00300 [Zostera marina]
MCNIATAKALVYVVYITSGISESKLKSCCVVCLKKPVNEEYKFCSLSCKLERVKLIGDCCFTVDEAERLAETYVAEQRRGRRGAN